MTTLVWIVLVTLILTSGWHRTADCRLIQHQRPAYEERYAPDEEIEAFMRSHNIRYPQVLDSRHHNKEDADLPYYYDYKSLPDSHHQLPYRPSQHHAIDDSVKNLHVQNKPQVKLPLHSSEHPIEDKHINLEKAPQPNPKQEDTKVKVESRSSAGHVGAHEVAAVAPGLSEALVQDEDSYRNTNKEASIADVYLLAVIAGCAIAAVSGLALTAACWYRLHKRVQATSDVEYPAYGVTGPTKEKSGPPMDRKLAQSAQMYHYQHQKQQMIASERLGPDHPGGNGGGSEGESEDECEEGDYTVFECPGLATTGEMEVRNPLFNDQTPVATPAEK